jgi:hypothetical protein
MQPSLFYRLLTDDENQASAVIIWDIAEFITLCVRDGRSFRRGIPPGAHVGVELIIWLMFAVMFSIACVFDSGSLQDTWYDRYGMNEDDLRGGAGVVVSAAVVMALLLYVFLLASPYVNLHCVSSRYNFPS